MGDDGNFYESAQAILGQNLIYKITPTGTFQLVSVFSTETGFIASQLLQGLDRNFYGSTYANASSDGSLFQVSPSGAFTDTGSLAGRSLHGLWTGQPRTGAEWQLLRVYQVELRWVSLHTLDRISIYCHGSVSDDLHVQRQQRLCFCSSAHLRQRREHLWLVLYRRGRGCMLCLLRIKPWRVWGAVSGEHGGPPSKSFTPSRTAPEAKVPRGPLSRAVTAE